MRIMILTSSPNKEGLTETCAKAAKTGVEKGKSEAVMVRLNDLKISVCKACGNGWGTCRTEYVCSGTNDDFQKIQKTINEVDGYIVITPVYFGEMSESLKVFFDRLRRCETIFSEGKSRLSDKPYLAVAAAGGSGNGTVSCLASMEKTLNTMKAKRFDLLGITKMNKDYMLKAIEAAAEKMVSK